MLVKSLTKELERINKKIQRITLKSIKIEDKIDNLYDKRHELKSLIQIEEMKERNKHEIHNK